MGRTPIDSERTSTVSESLANEGFFVLPQVIRSEEAVCVLRGLSASLSAQQEDAAAIQSRDGVVYAARNVLELFPEVDDVWRTPILKELLTDVLGAGCGLVRVLYFDKPPEQSWSLAWHRDQAIAVKDNRPPTTKFLKPTTKAGVPHVNAPHEILERMLTLRLHLDNVTEENGPLRVLPGSHLSTDGEAVDTDEAVTILAKRGDVLAMRPLLSHTSGKSAADSTQHRRILHFEFAADRELPDGYQWYWFRPLS
ncbi:MAG: phytanoyl-CoA dioxygenase family protein [Pirellulales bacterium]|nr:phytanoyl-CoA dioxygenase family protein [Pirellulales bacterium]